MQRCAYGCGPIPTSRKGYFDQNTALEVSEAYHELISGDTLHAWRREAGPELTMVLHANRYLVVDPVDEGGTGPNGDAMSDHGLLRPTDANKRLWAQVDAQARALHANIVTLRTPASFTPTKTNIKNFETFRAEIIGQVPYQVCWEPRGLWDPEEIDEMAAANNMIVARDPYSEFEFLDPPASDIVYTLQQPRGRRNFDRDDILELLDYFEEHEGKVTAIFRGAERKRNAYAFGVELRRSQMKEGDLDHFDSAVFDDED